jgi:hypothetical protein
MQLDAPSWGAVALFSDGDGESITSHIESGTRRPTVFYPSVVFFPTVTAYNTLASGT